MRFAVAQALSGSACKCWMVDEVEDGMGWSWGKAHTNLGTRHRTWTNRVGVHFNDDLMFCVSPAAATFTKADRFLWRFGIVLIDEDYFRELGTYCLTDTSLVDLKFDLTKF